MSALIFVFDTGLYPKYGRESCSRALFRQTLSSITSLSIHRPLIDKHILASGGFENLNSSVEKPRFLLLLDACQKEDYFFVALHQLFCLWAVDPNTVLQIDSFQDQQTVDYAFQLVTKLIRGNEGLSPLHLKWFTEFPAPLNDLLARSDHYRRTVSNVSVFLDKLMTEKTAMIKDCQKRGFPPLVDDMVSRLGLLSPVLQSVFFTASRRTLGIRDDGIGPEMERLFLVDREQHEKLAARYNTAFPPSEREVRERNAWLAQQYILLRNLVGSNAVPNSGTGSFANSSGSPNAPQFAFDNNASAQGPDLAGRFQTPREQSTRVDPPTGTPQNAVSQLAFQNTHRRPSGSLPSSHLPSQQLPEQGYTAQMPQPQLNINPSQMVQSILRSNHNLTPTNHTASNIYPGAVMSPQMQPNPFQMQINFGLSQQMAVQAQNYSQQQFQPQDPRQRLVSGASVEPHISNLRRINSVPTPSAVSQGPAPRGRILSPPVVRSTDGSRRTDHAARQNSTTGSWQIPLIPRNGESLPPHLPNPDITALHQAHLRSPYLVPIDKPMDLVPEDPAGRYYQAVLDFAVKPVILSQQPSLIIFNFVISNDLYAKIAKDKPFVGSPAAREVKRGSLQYRMRCIQVKRGQVRKTSDFIVSETAWPATIFMEINGEQIEVRRKLHYGKDLPVDITPFIRPVAELVNQIKISMPRPKTPRNDVDYDFAVEVIEILQHEQIVDMCWRRRIPAEQTINAIKASLSGSFIDNDDEISMAVGDLTINLADPFMARIFDIPVRGSSCLHRECFDLQTFLTTRNSKPKLPQQPSMVDVWRCPLCGKDARPYSLQVDEFLISVRKILAERDELKTKAIVISADGTWKPKPEALQLKRSASRAGLDEDDGDESEDDGTKKQEVPLRDRSKDIEVIELDDD